MAIVAVVKEEAKGNVITRIGGTTTTAAARSRQYPNTFILHAEIDDGGPTINSVNLYLYTDIGAAAPGGFNALSKVLA